MSNVIAKAAYEMVNQIKQNTPIFAVANKYTLDISTSKNFAIETADAVAKTIEFSNIPTTQNDVLSVSIKLKFTNNVAITYPASVAWKDNVIPAFAVGKQYLLLFESYDNGTTWLSSFIGAW